MPARVYLTLDVEGDSVTPAVAVDSSGGPNFHGETRGKTDLATVRAVTRITNRVLDFAEGIKS